MHKYIDTLIPLTIAVALLAFPQLFTKKNLSALENLKIRQKLKKSGTTLLVVAFMIFISRWGTELSGPSPKQKYLNAIVTETNKRMPIKIDECTILKRLENDTSSLIYIYEVSNSSLRECEKASLLKQLKAELLGKMKTHPNKQVFSKFDINVRSKYLTNDGKPIFDFTVTATEYK